MLIKKCKVMNSEGYTWRKLEKHQKFNIMGDIPDAKKDIEEAKKAIDEWYKAHCKRYGNLSVDCKFKREGEISILFQSKFDTDIEYLQLTNAEFKLLKQDLDIILYTSRPISKRVQTILNKYIKILYF